MNYPTAVDACAAYGEGHKDILKFSNQITTKIHHFHKKSAHICNSGGLLAAPNTAEVLELLSSTLNSEAVDDFWVGIDDM